jgi:universal stress protein A
VTFPTRVLLALDGSRESGLARDTTVDLLSERAAELHVVHVVGISLWTTPRNLSPTQAERLRAEGQEQLDGDLRELRGKGLDPRDHLRMGRATDEILRLRDEIEADLIVLGSRGRNAFSRVLLGSDAEGVVRHAPCAVLVVRSDR